MHNCALFPANSEQPAATYFSLFYTSLWQAGQNNFFLVFLLPPTFPSFHRFIHDFRRDRRRTKRAI